MQGYIEKVSGNNTTLDQFLGTDMKEYILTQWITKSKEI